MTRTPLLCLVIISALLPGATYAAQSSDVHQKIYTTRQPDPLETLAAREVRRYVYLRTGQMLPIEAVDVVPTTATGIVVARSGTQGLGSEAFTIRSQPDGRPLVTLAGGSPMATLYAAYRFAEHLGVRFYMEGDVVPDGRIDLKLTGFDERREPLFEFRGIQPFHDFPEGPDWWETSDYKAILAQLPKLGMNFFGLHTYPEGHPNAEPTVWIGPADQVNADGTVKSSYVSSYMNSLRGNWGYAPQKTGDYAFGSAALFDRDCYGCEVMRGACSQPATPDDQNALFNRAAAMLREAFQFGRALGVKTCVGTEVPLTVPRAVRQRYPDADAQKLYEGIFTRIMRAYPIDFYWFWTPEGWTWRAVAQETVDATIRDMQQAVAAAEKVKAPFRLATCGWVLGPQTDRSLFDRVLPKDMPLSCINRHVGMTPVEPGFADVKRKDKWAIPWLEDDPALTSVQLWAGRMRKDAADARDYGCNGLMGIHWRTRILGPNVSALAKASWDQTGWKQQPPASQIGPIGGEVVTYANSPIADTEDDPLYQSVRYNLTAYRLAVPNGTYRVVLQFCEPHYKEAGKRVFGVKLQGKQVIDRLDMFAKFGKDRAFDAGFDDIEVTDGLLNIDFVPIVEFPCIAAIRVEGKSFSLKINSGGPAYKDYIADPPPPPRDLPTTDFYRDWAAANFGPQAAGEIAAIFERLDGKLPRPTQWVAGPGGVQPDGRPWEKVRPEYDFIEELSRLRDRVRGAGNLERFDYWVANFRYMRAIAWTNCLWAQFNAAMEKVRAEKDAAKRKDLASELALPLRRGMVLAVKQVFECFLPTVSNTGEMGTVMNLNQHLMPYWLSPKVDKELAEALGQPLPPETQPTFAYVGPPRVIVPTVRTSLAAGEPLKLKVIILAESPAGQTESPRPAEAAIHWRPLAKGEFQNMPLRHVARGVYSVQLPAAASGDDFEYYVEAKWPDSVVRFPATAPETCQTVVIMPPL